MHLSILVLLYSATRIAAQAPSYSPYFVDCPNAVSNDDGQLNLVFNTGSPLAGTQSLYPQESEYVQRRQEDAAQTWQDFLEQTETGYDVATLLANDTETEGPKLAIAVSGGGYRYVLLSISLCAHELRGGWRRAAIYGAGSLLAFDDRNESAVAPALQLSSYLSGLSGGSWLVTSLIMNDFPDLWSLVTGTGDEDQPGWLLDYNLIAPAGLIVTDNNAYYDTLIADVQVKAENGFPVSITDIWSRALAYHMFNQTTPDNFYDTQATHDQGLLWSSLRYVPSFQNAEVPLPLVVALTRPSEEQQTDAEGVIIPLVNTQVEFSPFTFGSYDPSLGALVDVDLAGTPLDSGAPLNSSACVNGFSNAAFVIGTSSSLFNAAQELVESPTIANLIQRISSDALDISDPAYSVPLVANWGNSFKSLEAVGANDSDLTWMSADNDVLELVDGGLNGENVPLMPLLVKSRAVDAILALDGSADTDDNYANGTSLYATSERASQVFPQDWVSFPPLPEGGVDEFVSLGLNERTTFFGCNSTQGGNVSDAGVYPIVIYVPNSPYPTRAPASNYSTFDLDYTPDEVASFLFSAQTNARQGYTNDTLGGERDQMLPTCLACAFVDRARLRKGVARSDACEQCFERYCYVDGVTDAPSNAENVTENTSGGNDSGGENTASLASPNFNMLALGATTLAMALFTTL